MRKGFELPFGLTGAAAAADAVRRGVVQSGALVDAVLAGLPDRNAKLKAIVVTCADRAVDEAGEIDDERRRLAALRAAWSGYFGGVDAFVCPVNFTAAIEHDDRPFEQRIVSTIDGERRYDEQPFWTAQPTAAGLPA